MQTSWPSLQHAFGVDIHHPALATREAIKHLLHLVRPQHNLPLILATNLGDECWRWTKQLHLYFIAIGMAGKITRHQASLERRCFVGVGANHKSGKPMEWRIAE